MGRCNALCATSRTLASVLSLQRARRGLAGLRRKMRWEGKNLKLRRLRRLPPRRCGSWTESTRTTCCPGEPQVEARHQRFKGGARRRRPGEPRGRLLGDAATGAAVTWLKVEPATNGDVLLHVHPPMDACVNGAALTVELDEALFSQYGKGR